MQKLIGPNSVVQPNEDLSTLTVVNNALGDKAPTNAAKLENMGDTGSSLIKPKQNNFASSRNSLIRR